MSLILNHSQAQAVYSAMCALNNVGAKLSAAIPSPDHKHIFVEEFSAERGVLVISGWSPPGPREDYPDQAAFATAYGLISGEPQNAVAAAAGGLTQTAIER